MNCVRPNLDLANFGLFRAIRNVPYDCWNVLPLPSSSSEVSVLPSSLLLSLS